MEWLKVLVNRFTEAFRWWFVLQPWEQALRVRAGKTIRKFEGGIHFRVPYLDAIFKQNCRLRISDMTQTTVTTANNSTITMAGALRYRVVDVEPLYNALHMAENTIIQYVQGVIAKYVAVTDEHECTPAHIVDHVNENIRQLEEWGLGELEFILTDYARVRTYRLIQGAMDRWNDFSLQTNEPDEEY